MQKENLKSWIMKNFALTFDQFLEVIKSKPLREFAAVFNGENRCPFNCSHCFMVEADDQANPLTPDEVHRLFSTRSARARDHEIYYYLQDPASQMEEVLPILEKFPQQYLEIDPSIFLNRPDLFGTLRDLGIKWIAYSLHGDYIAHHNLTGQSKERWQRLLEGSRAAAAEGFLLEISSCIYAENADRVESLCQVIDSVKAESWFVNRVVPVGKAKQWPLERFLYGESCGAVVRKISRYFGQMQNVKHSAFDVTWGPNFYGTTGKAILGRRGETERGIYNCHTPSDVELGINNFWTSKYTGQVFPCIYAIGVSELCLGVFEKGKIKLNWEVAENYRPENRLGKLTGICRPEECGFAPICVGCRSVAHAFASKISPVRPIPANVGLDFCLTRYIRDCLDDAEAMADLSPIIRFPPFKESNQ